MSLPFLAKKPIDLPPIVSVELIQITDKTNIPFAPKAKKTIEKNEVNSIQNIDNGSERIDDLDYFLNDDEINKDK